MDAITSTIEKAYADGFADGYREAGIRLKAIETFSLESDVEYVDLGLPSGTLWSSANVKVAASFVTLPYIKAEKLNIPTEQQFLELCTNCRIEDCHKSGNYFKFTGTNGEHITIICTKNDGSPLERGYEPSISFWLKDDDENTTSKNHAWISERREGLIPVITKLFMGKELPVMLVL